MNTIILGGENGNYFSLSFKYDLTQEQEIVGLRNIVKLLKEKFGYEIESNMLLLGLPPYCKFAEKNGISVYVALDEFHGLSVDSNSQDFLKKLQPYLEDERFISGEFEVS